MTQIPLLRVSFHSCRLRRLTYSLVGRPNYTWRVKHLPVRIFNKFAQSNLGRGPRASLSHIGRKVPIGYNGATQILPQKYPFPWTDPQTPLPASSLDPSDLWCQMASGSDPQFCHNALDSPSDRRTYVRTDRQTDRPSTGKFDDYRSLR